MKSNQIFKKIDFLFNKNVFEIILIELETFDKLFIEKYYIFNEINICLNLNIENKVISSNLRNNIKYLFLPKLSDNVMPKYTRDSWEGYISWVASKRFDLSNNYFDDFINVFEKFTLDKSFIKIDSFFKVEEKDIFKYFTLLGKGNKILFNFDNQLSDLIEGFKPDIIFDVINLYENKNVYYTICHFMNIHNINKNVYFELSNKSKFEVKKIIPYLNI